MLHTEGNASGEVAPFIKKSDIYSFWLLLTLKEATTIVSTMDLSFIHNLIEGDNMEMAYALPHDMFEAAYILFIFYVGWGEVMAQGYPFKEMNTWREKVKALKLKCTNLQKELIWLKEEVKATNSL